MIPLGVSSSGRFAPNLLSSPDDHSTAAWSSEPGWTASISDVDGGSTAEQWVEHSGSGSRNSIQYNIATSAGAHQMDYYYKQKSGSNSARRLSIGISNYPDWDREAIIVVDETGTVTGATTTGSGFSVNSSQISASTNSFYFVTFKFTVNVTALNVFLEHLDDADSGTYTGDGSSGWIIDNHRLYKI